MLLLNFGVQNHISIRDQAILTFIKPSFKTLRPRKDESWQQNTYPVIGVFGPNASGKSSLIDALHYLVTAVTHSATSWLSYAEFPGIPFALDAKTLQAPREFALDFVLAGIRYEYVFAVEPDRVLYEELQSLPDGKRRKLFSRNADGIRYTHSSVGKIGEIAARELVLSRALILNHEVLAPIAWAITTGIDVVPLGEEPREKRLSYITEALAAGRLSRTQITTLLQIADVGICDVEVKEQTIPPAVREFAKRFNKLVAEVAEETNQSADKSVKQPVKTADPTPISDEVLPETLDAIAHSLAFTHHGAPDNADPFTLAQESTGTIAWLAIAVPALEALKNGTVLCADEIDSSLHSHLVDVLIEFFQDPELNPLGAQLVFTSHDTYLLSPT